MTNDDVLEGGYDDCMMALTLSTKGNCKYIDLPHPPFHLNLSTEQVTLICHPSPSLKGAGETNPSYMYVSTYISIYLFVLSSQNNPRGGRSSHLLLPTSTNQSSTRPTPTIIPTNLMARYSKIFAAPSSWVDRRTESAYIKRLLYIILTLESLGIHCAIGYRFPWERHAVICGGGEDVGKYLDILFYFINMKRFYTYTFWGVIHFHVIPTVKDLQESLMPKRVGCW